MSQTLRNFINAREGEVKAQIKALNDELRELRAAKHAIDGAPATSPTGATSSRFTHRDMIVAVLDERPEGGTSDKVIEWVNDRYSVNISQASMSSQLSRAKSDGAVTLEQGTKIWRSALHSTKENEPPEGGSESEGVATPSHQESPRTMPGLPSAVQGTGPTPFGSREGGQQDV